MQNTSQKIPLLRPALALIVGIICGNCIDIPCFAIISFAIIIVVLLFLLNKKYRFNFESFFGALLIIQFILIGILSYKTYNAKPDFHSNCYFQATIKEIPEAKDKTFKTILQVTHIKKADSVFSYHERLLAYFNKCEKVKKLKPGDQILFKSSPQFIKNAGNPFEFDHKAYQALKRIYRQVYLSANDWKKITGSTNFSLFTFAKNTRAKLLLLYQKQKLGKKQLEILAALTLGYKQSVDHDTRRVFSSTGAMHVLAVSGLHVGIIYWVITLIFGVFRKYKKGRFFFIISAITLIWCFALITGLSPSVMRASTMISIIIIGENIRRKTSIYNTLAASAILLLIMNPNNLFLAGFQLSYSAVLGIVYLQPKIFRLISVKSLPLKYLWTLFTVSIAAQISTFPITAYYFNQFPSYFWLTNIFVIPVVMLLVPMGFALLILSDFTIVSTLISDLINLILKFTYILLTKIEELPHSILEITLNKIDLIFIYGIITCLFLMIHKFKPAYIQITLFFILIFQASSLYYQLKQHFSHEIIIYNTKENLTVHLISGFRNFVISQSSIGENDQIKILVDNTKRRLNLNRPQFFIQSDTIHKPELYLKKGLLLFEGKSILLNNKTSTFPDGKFPDYIINHSDIKELENTTQGTWVIIMNKRYFHSDSNIFKRFHNLSTRGSFREKW